MPTIEEVDDDFGDPDDMVLDAPPLPPPSARAPPAGAGGLGSGFLNMGNMPKAAFHSNKSSLRTSYQTVKPEVCKDWTSIYPIYLDAKKPQRKGCRRVSKEYALQWPLAEHIARGCTVLGFEAVYEPEKSHPKEWENPGRVKVLLKKDGVPTHSELKDKQSLLKALGKVLAPMQPQAPAPTESNPNPLPPIHLRLPPHSPAISHGVLESAMKGGGPMGMLGNMMGGGAAEEKEEETPAVKKKEPPKVQKLKPIRGRRR